MILDAYQLTTYQSCRRRWILERSYLPAKWRVHSLFDNVLRRSMFRLSRNRPIQHVLSEAAAEFMSAAADPGLDAYGIDTYTLARDHVGMLGTVLTALSQASIPVFHEPEPIALTDRVSWKPLAWADDSGQLHRLVTVSSWGQAEGTRQAHGWFVSGDMAALGVPMTLHAIVIGDVREGRRVSPWTRAWKCKTAPNIPYRFKKSKNSDAEWTPYYAADFPVVGKFYTQWVERMHKEGIVEEVIRHAIMKQLDDAACVKLRTEIVSEAERMEVDGWNGWEAMPMSRGACDGVVPCPLQQVCYGGGDPSRVLRPRLKSPVPIVAHGPDYSASPPQLCPSSVDAADRS